VRTVLLAGLIEKGREMNNPLRYIVCAANVDEAILAGLEKMKQDIGEWDDEKFRHQIFEIGDPFEGLQYYDVIFEVPDEQVFSIIKKNQSLQFQMPISANAGITDAIRGFLQDLHLDKKSAMDHDKASKMAMHCLKKAQEYRERREVERQVREEVKKRLKK